MEHPYHSIGARQDRAQTLAVLTRIADALERIAELMATEPKPVFYPEFHTEEDK